MFFSSGFSFFESLLSLAIPIAIGFYVIYAWFFDDSYKNKKIFLVLAGILALYLFFTLYSWNFRL